MTAIWSSRAEQIVLNLIANLGPDQNDPYETDAIRLNALPICVSLWASYYLRPNGKVVIVGKDYDQPNVDTIDDSPMALLKALVCGAERYPELRVLLPTRDRNATDCICRQHQEVFGPGKMICSECGGLGWLSST